MNLPPKKVRSIRFVFKKDFENNKFYCEIFQGNKKLFTSELFKKKEYIKHNCNVLVEEIIEQKYTTTDITKCKRGPNPKHTESVQEKLYKELKKENGIE